MSPVAAPERIAVVPERSEFLSAAGLVPVMVLVGFWLIALATVSLAGNFPLNDDWIYSEGVKHFLETGELRLLACAPACVFHLLSGALVCKFTGFSHEALRGLGFLWALVATLALYGSFRELRLNRAAATVFALTFAANPLTVNLAFSFMTDMPSLALVALYTFLLLKGCRNNASWAFWLGGLCLAAAACVRQNFAMLALPNALVLLFLWCTRRHSWSLLFGLVILPLLAGWGADKWMVASNDYVDLYAWYKGRAAETIGALLHAPSRLAGPLTQIAGAIACYVGLFCAPVLVPFLTKPSLWLGRHPAVAPLWTLISGSVMAYSLTQVVAVAGKLMPFNQNLLRMPAVGAHTILGINHANLSNKARLLLTQVSGFLATLLLALLAEGAWRAAMVALRTARRAGRAGHGWERVFRACAVGFVFVSLAVQSGCVLIQSSFNDIDRYYVFPFASGLLCLAVLWRWLRVRPVYWICAPLLGLYAWYSVAACQDMMAWNRSRWSGIAALERTGVVASAIDGGAEYNYFANPPLFKNLKIHPTWYEFTHRGDPPRDNWRWWSVDREDYIVSFSPVPDYEVADRRRYWSALTMSEREVLVLRKISARLGTVDDSGITRVNGDPSNRP